jgi:hypothetical protein
MEIRWRHGKQAWRMGASAKRAWRRRYRRTECAQRDFSLSLNVAFLQALELFELLGHGHGFMPRVALYRAQLEPPLRDSLTLGDLVRELDDPIDRREKVLRGLSVFVHVSGTASCDSCKRIQVLCLA